MRNKYIAIIIALLIANVFLAWQGYAQVETQGMLDSPDTPANTQSYSLEDIYNRLDNGATGVPSAFIEPSQGPTTGTGHTLDEVMSQAPAADNAAGAAPGEVLTGKTYWSLRTDGAWGPQTGTAPIAASPKTGQTRFFASGDDGDLEKGAAWPSPRFTDNGDGTVTDHLTKLVWLKNADCNGTSNWENALSFANNLKSGDCDLEDGSGAGEWRLPNVRELSSLIDFSQVDPALSDEAVSSFANIQGPRYWSSTTLPDDPTTPNSTDPLPWYVDIRIGSVFTIDKGITLLYTWPVRDGQ